MLRTDFTYNEFYNLMYSILNNSFGISTNKISDICQYRDYTDFKFRRIIWPNFDNSIEDNMENNLGDTIYTYYKSLPVINSLIVISTFHTLLETFIESYNPSNMYHIDFCKNKIERITYDDKTDSEFYDEYYKKI